MTIAGAFLYSRYAASQSGLLWMVVYLFILVIKLYISTINDAMGMLCALVESTKSVHCTHFDFFVDRKLIEMNVAI